MAKADQSTLVIKELTGLKRVVTLRGPSLPFQGATWGGEQRVTTTWYPGNAVEATQHVLGPTEKPSSWTGVWRTTMMVRTPTLFSEAGGSVQRIVRASTLALILENMFRLGQRLRVEWQNTLPRTTTISTANGQLELTSIVPEETVRIVREGRCLDWDWGYERSDDIDWSMTFDWSSRGARQQKVVTRRQEDVAAVITGLQLEIANAIARLESNALVRSNRALQVPNTNTLSLGDLENIADFPAALLQQFTRAALRISNRLKQIGELIDKVRSIPAQLANQLLDVANNAVAIAAQFTDTMSRQPPESNVARVKAAQLSKAAEFFNDATTQADLIARAALGIRTIVQDSAKQEKTILAVHVVRQSEQLTAISLQFYGTPDEAASIAKANLLPLNQQTVERGTVLIIPTLDAIKKFNPQGG